MPRPSRATAHHFAENAPTQTRAPSRASGFVLPPGADVHSESNEGPVWGIRRFLPPRLSGGYEALLGDLRQVVRQRARCDRFLPFSRRLTIGNRSVTNSVT